MAAVTNNIQRKESLSEELEAQNLLRLKTFSKSLEDLTSETLYSKWKRARASPAKNPGRRGRSFSLITVPEMIREEKETEERSRKNSFYDLQEVFRPRFWSTGGIYEENESEAVGDFGNLLPRAQQVLLPCWQKSDQEQDAVNSSDKENHIMDDQDILIAKPLSEDVLSAANTSYKTSPFSNKREVNPKFPREPPKKRDDIPIVVQAINDEELKDTRGILREKKSNTNKCEAVPIVSPKRRASSPASVIVVDVQPKTLPECMANFNGVRRTCSESSGSQNAQPLKPDKEGERASLRMYYTSLGCTTYAIVSQPLQTAKNANVIENTAGPTNRSVSDNVPMEVLTSSGEGHQILKRLSRASSLKEESSREAQSGEVCRRLSVQTKRVTRPTARDLLSNIANTAHKTEKDRLRDIERAFDWVRKELADLRAQDKDIMRMFTKIQAGIRQIQMNKSISESSESSFDEEATSPRYNTMSKSVSTNFTPPVKEISTYDTFPRRRASLI